MIKRNFVSWGGTALFSALISLTMTSTDIRAQDTSNNPPSVRDFIVVATPQAPHKFEDQKGQTGIDVDIIRKFFNTQNITAQIKFTTSGKRLLREAKQGRAEMVLLISKNSERESFLDYPNQSYINLGWQFVIRTNDKDKIKFETVEDLKGLRVGATEGYSYTPTFWESGLNLIITQENKLHIQRLLKNRIDIVPMNAIRVRYDAFKDGYSKDIAILPKALIEKPYYNAFVKASNYPNLDKVRESYDRFIIALRESGEIKRIKQKYLGNH
ncbi:MAG: transporter substrate-binding domain-containing protein [Alphaproteobacteria bacterium]|nr:transporter substrate-binding domain-containing protein [Alphaproteobacteria bacterium]